MGTNSEETNSDRPVEEFISELKSFIQEHHPKTSPIIQSIVKGTASKNALQKFAKALNSLFLRAFLCSNFSNQLSFGLTRWLLLFSLLRNKYRASSSPHEECHQFSFLGLAQIPGLIVKSAWFFPEHISLFVDMFHSFKCRFY